MATRSPRRVVGMHFFNPAPVHGVRRGRSAPSSPSPTCVDDVTAPRPPARQERRSSSATRPASSRTRCCSATSTTRSRCSSRSYATREDIDAAMRLGCGLPDGPAGAARPHRPGHRLRDPRHDVQAGPRPPARAGPAAQADGHRRPAAAARPAAASTPTQAPDQPDRRRRRATPPRPTPAPRLGRAVRAVGVVGSGTMATGIVEVLRQGRLRRLVRRPRPGEGRARVASGRRARAWRRRSSAASSTRRPSATPRSRRITGTTEARRPRRGRPRDRGGRRGARASSRRCSRTSTRSAGRARSSPPPRRRCR